MGDFGPKCCISGRSYPTKRKLSNNFSTGQNLEGQLPHVLWQNAIDTITIIEIYCTWWSAALWCVRQAGECCMDLV